ncbi:MAG: FAD-dependent oxidoreductase, partial [Planctomycetota bacterium]
MGLKPDVIVVGGGIWGASTALHVVRSSPGIRVVVVDRAPALAAETTGQAAGQIGQLRANPLMLRAVGYTLELLGSFRERTGHDPGFVRSGSIHLALTADRMTALRAMAERVRPMGVAVEEVDGERARWLVPL